MIDTLPLPTVSERLRRLSRIGVTYWLLLVTWALTAGAAAFLLAGQGSARYSATASLVFDESQLVGLSGSTPLVPNPDPERDINTKVALIVSPPVARAVKAQLRLSAPLTRVMADVSAQTANTSNLVDVTATADAPPAARALANAFADQYVAYRRALARSSFDAAAAAIQDQLDRLAARRGAAAAAASPLNAQLRQFQVAAAAQSGGAVVISHATGVTPVTAHRRAELTAAGFAAGLLLAVAMVALLEFTDGSVKDADEVRRALPIRILAEVPRAGRLRERAGVGVLRRRNAVYDALAGELLLARRRRPLESILITSPGSRDGKTTVTAGLAAALQRLGHRVEVRAPEAPTPAADAGRSAAFVLIDGPAALGLHAATHLLDGVDAVLLVTRLRWTATASLLGALETIDAFGLPLLGLVLTDSRLAGPPQLGIDGPGALIPLEIAEGHNGSRGRQPHRLTTDRQTATAGQVRVRRDDGRSD